MTTGAQKKPGDLILLGASETRRLGSVWSTLRHMRSEHRALAPKVPCNGCTACCRGGYEVQLLPAEVPHFAHVEGTDGTPILPQRPDGSCHYLGADGCTVYKQRPLACQVYDCRLFALAGVLPGELNQEGFQPFAFGIGREEDRVALLAYRLAVTAGTQRGWPLEAACRGAMEHWERWLPEAQRIAQEINHNPAFRAKVLAAIGMTEDDIHGHPR